MSYGLTANDWADAGPVAPPPSATPGLSVAGLIVLPPDAPAQVYRSPVIPIAFALPVAVSALSYLGGGVAPISDLAFLILVVLCATLLGIELVKFGSRQGLGAILIYGGILVWFCHDYASNWFNHDYTQFNSTFPDVTAFIVSRALFYHCLFIDLMVLAFRFPVFRFVDRLVVIVPEPADTRLYLALVVALLLFGWTAFIATADPLPVSLVKACLWFVPGVGSPIFTTGRTGNMNYNWGGYLAQVLQVGQIGGILASFYALLVARSTAGRVFGWAVWLFWFSYSFTSYRRGDIAFMALPIMTLVFLKYHAQPPTARRTRSLVWLVATGIMVAGTWLLVQEQTAVRWGNAPLQVFRASGNTMFSEGLNAWVIIPDQIDHPYDKVFGEGIIRPLPETAWAFVTGPIPRALWRTKPIEQFALWYSAMISKDKRGLTSGGVIGTTVSGGAVGSWYFRYGPAGVVEGGLLYGWMMGVAERALRRAQGQPIKVLFSLMFATFMFRCFRDLWWHNLDPIMIAAAVMYVLVRLFFGGNNANQPHAVPMGAVPA